MVNKSSLAWAFASLIYASQPTFAILKVYWDSG